MSGRFKCTKCGCLFYPYPEDCGPGEWSSECPKCQAGESEAEDHDNCDCSACITDLDWGDDESIWGYDGDAL